MAMRNFLFVKAASLDFRVKVVVVPVVGRTPMPASSQAAEVQLPGRAQIAASLPRLLATPAWRERLSAAYPLPPLAAMAPPVLAPAVVEAARAAPGTAVHAARSYLMPLAIAVAQELGSPWSSADLDDDDDELAAAAGNEDEARAYRRLIRVFAPLFDGLSAASPGEAAALATRHGLDVTVIPNAVAWPQVPGQRVPHPETRGAAGRNPDRSTGPGRAGVRLLFVGNLTYWPNADAAARLVREVLPRLRPLIPGPVTVTLVGDCGSNHGLMALGREPGVRLTGFAADLGPCYREADVLVVPLAFGAGTRIKILEAFSHGVPVVTSPAGAAGLELADGVHALIADSAGGLAGAVARLMTDDGLRLRLVAAAGRLVRERYSHEQVIPQIRGFFKVAASSPVDA